MYDGASYPHIIVLLVTGLQSEVLPQRLLELWLLAAMLDQQKFAEYSVVSKVLVATSVVLIFIYVKSLLQQREQRESVLISCLFVLLMAIDSQ